MRVLAFQKLDQIEFDKFYLTRNVRNLKFALFTGDETTRFNLCVTLREQPGRFRNKGRNIAIYPIGFPGVLFNIIATQGHKRWVFKLEVLRLAKLFQMLSKITASVTLDLY